MIVLLFHAHQLTALTKAHKLAIIILFWLIPCSRYSLYVGLPDLYGQIEPYYEYASSRVIVYMPIISEN